MMSPARPDNKVACRTERGLQRGLQRGFQRGFTMIEALVTFVILAIGILGIVTLMTTSKTSQFEAVQRVRAVNLADNLLERIRENPAALDTYLARDEDNPLGQGQIATEPSPNCETATCTPDEMAAHDLWVWEQQLDGNRVTAPEGGTAGLRAARGCIEFTVYDPVNDPLDPRLRTGEITVRVQWEGLQETVDGVGATETVCGDGTGGDNRRRRQVVVNSFVVDDL